MCEGILDAASETGTTAQLVPKYVPGVGTSQGKGHEETSSTFMGVNSSVNML